MSFSQLGQDVEVARFYSHKPGFFVEVGASDGRTLSNTLLLELKYKWRGICCEPLPGKYAELVKNRRCLCVNRAVYNADLTLDFKVGKNTLLSGLDPALDPTQVQRTIQVKTITLLGLLRQAKAPKFIEYLSLDTEGSEFEILQAFDFSQYTFGLIDVEHNYTPARQKIRDLLLANGYLYKGPNKFDDMYVHSRVVQNSHLI